MKLKTEHVYSPILDHDIKIDIKNSEIWQECYHKEELIEPFNGYLYVIAFDGLNPVHVHDIKKIN